MAIDCWHLIPLHPPFSAPPHSLLHLILCSTSFSAPLILCPTSFSAPPHFLPHLILCPTSFSAPPHSHTAPSTSSSMPQHQQPHSLPHQPFSLCSISLIFCPINLILFAPSAFFLCPISLIFCPIDLILFTPPASFFPFVIAHTRVNIYIYIYLFPDTKLSLAFARFPPNWMHQMTCNYSSVDWNLWSVELGYDSGLLIRHVDWNHESEIVPSINQIFIDSVIRLPAWAVVWLNWFCLFIVNLFIVVKVQWQDVSLYHCIIVRWWQVTSLGEARRPDFNGGERDMKWKYMQSDVMAGYKSIFSPLKLGTRASMRHCSVIALNNPSLPSIMGWMSQLHQVDNLPSFRDIYKTCLVSTLGYICPSMEPCIPRGKRLCFWPPALADATHSLVSNEIPVSESSNGYMAYCIIIIIIISKDLLLRNQV